MLNYKYPPFDMIVEVRKKVLEYCEKMAPSKLCGHETICMCLYIGVFRRRHDFLYFIKDEIIMYKSLKNGIFRQNRDQTKDRRSLLADIQILHPHVFSLKYFSFCDKSKALKDKD